MADQNDIQFHYDLGNDFFTLFLDETYKVYSCGVWANADTLEQAQENKLKRISDFARVKSDHKLLDIGCGWGGMLQYVTKKRCVKNAVGITLSQAQYDYVVHHDNKNISVYLSSWQNFESPFKFDSIVSVGAMEHFASLEDRDQNKHIDVYRHFFQKSFDLLKPNGYMGLQTIVTTKAPDSLQSMRDTHYLLKCVFPGSMLPQVNDIKIAMQKLFEPVEQRLIGLDYVTTLKHWKERLNRRESDVLKKYGQSLMDHYNHYFDAAIRSFENGHVNLLQLSLKKI